MWCNKSNYIASLYSVKNLKNLKQHQVSLPRAPINKIRLRETEAHANLVCVTRTEADVVIIMRAGEGEGRIRLGGT